DETIRRITDLGIILSEHRPRLVRASALGISNSGGEIRAALVRQRPKRGTRDRGVDSADALFVLIEEPDGPRGRADGIIQWALRDAPRGIGLPRLRRERGRITQPATENG